jgi:glycosyltransferase involved in cell wall biosynthesis
VAAIRGEGAALLNEARAGIVTPIGDSAGYTAAVRSVAENHEQRVAMGQAGRRYAEAALSPQAVKEAYLTILERARQA